MECVSVFQTGCGGRCYTFRMMDDRRMSETWRELRGEFPEGVSMTVGAAAGRWIWADFVRQSVCDLLEIPEESRDKVGVLVHQHATGSKSAFVPPPERTLCVVALGEKHRLGIVAPDGKRKQTVLHRGHAVVLPGFTAEVKLSRAGYTVAVVASTRVPALKNRFSAYSRDKNL